MHRFLFIICMSIGLLTTSVARAQADAPTEGATAQNRYELCLRYFKRGYYTKALETCNRVRNFHRDDPVSVLAELAIADIYCKRGDFEQCRLTLQDFVRLHPRHARVDYAVWKIGWCWYKVSPKWAGRDQTTTQQAVNNWTSYNQRFPQSNHLVEVSDLLGKARDRLAAKEISIARFYRRRGAWKATRNRTQGMLERYGDTSYAAEGMALLGESHHAWGNVQTAQQVRERLAEKHPESTWLKRLDRTLAGEPGEAVEEKTFLRPYKIPAIGGAAAQAQPGAGGPQ
ncbi:MAG: outer membrane protein assembly factor BamD [Kiritimatiellia bacterium]|jgi:outer membrane protein assembly factor BamD